MSDTKIKRSRNFVAIGYPESLKPNWKEILEETHIQVVISPLHDIDKNVDGTPKKAHYHIMILYLAPHTMEQAQEVFDSIGATQCQIVNDTRGQARYLCHLDNLEKERYQEKDVVCLNGIDYLTLIELPSDNWQAVREMIKFINDYNIVSYADILEYASINNPNWFKVLLEKNTLVINEYIKSRYWRMSNDIPKKINMETGEILDNTDKI